MSGQQGQRMGQEIPSEMGARVGQPFRRSWLRLRSYSPIDGRPQIKRIEQK